MLLKRDDINKQVLKQHVKAFPLIFEKANSYLHHVFGMKLVELPSRENLKSTQETCFMKGPFALVSVLSWKERQACISYGNQQETVTLLTIILSMIFGCGGFMPEGKTFHFMVEQLLTSLCDAGITGDKLPLDMPVKSMDQLLLYFIKQGYLEKLKKEATLDYTWGPRAKIEFPPKNMISFILSLHSDFSPREQEKLLQDLDAIVESWLGKNE